MGPEDKTDMNNGTLYIDNTPIARGEIQLPEITLPTAAQESGAHRELLCEPMEFTLRFKTPKRWRCRSRKRFIKLLMSKRISRNEAEIVARVTRIAGVPYGELWRSYFFWGCDL